MKASAFSPFGFDGGDYVIDGHMQRDAAGHMKDGYAGTLQGKLPWHPTFSDESPFSSDLTPGGKWSKMPNGAYSYTPSQWQVQQGYTQGLATYFQNHNPNGKLQAPIPYSDEVLK